MPEGQRNIVHMWVMCLALLASCGVVLFGCDESLPPRDDPTNLLHVVLLVQGGEYTFRYTQPFGFTPMSVAIQVSNDYNEVFEDSLYMRGTVEIWDTRRPNVRGSVNMRYSQVIPSYALNNGILTLEAGAQLTFTSQWSHLTAGPGQTVPIWYGVDTTARLDPYGRIYYVTDTMYLGAQASVQIFRKAGSVRSNACVVPVVYRIIVPADTRSRSSEHKRLD